MATMVTPVLKMQRAKEHLDVLEKALLEFFTRKPSPYRGRRYDDREAGECVLELTIDDPPLEFGIIAGDFISNLRSCLDWLAWQLSALSGNMPPDSICFPIIGKYSTGAEGKIRNSTIGIPDRAVAIMRELQPYNYPGAYRETHLWRLHKLWNIEKHRHLMGNIASIEFKLVVPEGVRVSKKIIDKGGEVRFPLSAKGKVQFEPNKTNLLLGFGDEKQGIVLTYDDFVEIYEFVSDKVIPRFKRFFA